MSSVPFLLLFVEFKKDDRLIVEERKKSTISRLPLDVRSPSFGAPRDRSYENCLLQNKVRDDAFGGAGDEEVVVGEGVVVTYSSLEMLTNSCLGGIMVSLIFLEGLEEEALVEFMVKRFEEDEDGKKNGNDDLLN
uniref:Uncharacterized protein n=1 Tax=Tanacetum cinerariifolium TaxID=118510 RepID=A0A6L2MJ07_TANCI|nr:hypothetical protein [Tanacetum cinerariifolium]